MGLLWAFVKLRWACIGLRGPSLGLRWPSLACIGHQRVFVSLVAVVVGGQGKKHPPTGRRDSLVVLVGGRGKKHPPTCHRNTLVVVVVVKGRRGVVEAKKATNESLSRWWWL
jgi:hypothetical protein